ncbi:MAG: WecB/TagA/CpsF family glycosyltransferase [Thermoanaerobaculales bacterium]
MRALQPPTADQPAPVATQPAIADFEKAVFLGVGISRVDHLGLIRFVVESAATHRRALVNNVNVHAMNLARRDARFAAALNESDVVFCDGFGLKLAADWAGVRLGERMTPPDWIDALFEACARTRLSVFFLGDEERVVAAFAAEVARRHPRLRIAGWHHGFFDVEGEENRCVVESIKASRPDVIVTGMGMPRQELWAHDNLQALDGGVIVAAGGLFRMYTGLVRRCPPWLSRRGFEWAWRLAQEPRRLFARYTFENAAFLMRVIYAVWLKRVLDLVIASGLFVLALPVLVVCWALVRLESAGPAIFAHERVGKDGRRFRMYKFRTLPVGFPVYARKQQVKLSESTAVGRFLRRTALDELPQLINVIKGDMALVGPRPEMPFIADGYRDRERVRITVKPGATGPWQIARLRGAVDGRTIHEDLSYDLGYLRRVGPYLDLSILTETAVCMAALSLRSLTEPPRDLGSTREGRHLPT